MVLVKRYHSYLILLHVSGRHRMIVYQTRGVRTGGTVALNSLYETLRDLGCGA